MDVKQVHGDGRRARPGAWAAVAAAAVLLSVLQVAAQAAGRVALVIGNAAYHDPESVLRNPGNDAEGMAAALGRLGFEVVLGKDLDRGGFYDKLDEFEVASRDADVTLFFYAGHGLQVAGENWLMPVDARLEKKRDLDRRAVKLDAVMREMGGTKKLVFLDACRNNPLARGLARSMGMTRSEASNRGLARVKGVPGTLVVYATEAGGVADDGGGRNSPFTEALLAHIERPELNVFAMVGEVAQSVYQATGEEQLPSIQSSPVGLGNFHLAAAAAPPDDEGTETAGGGTDDTATPPPGTEEAARAAFKEAKEVGNVEALEAIVKHFPGTFEADLAQAEIAKREGQAKPLVVAGGDDPEEEVSSSAPSPAEVEQGLGLSREARRLVQMGLAAAGQDPGPADGMFGGKTRRALRSWQGSKEVEATGYLTREQGEVLAALGREESGRLRAEAERKAREAEERRQRAQAPRTKFRDCPGCPELVVVPEGTYRMGSPSSESGRDGDEGPQHQVAIARPFAVGVYEVTFGEWDACVSDGGCNGYRPSDEGWGRGRRPVINVSWNDAQAYVKWLSGKTGQEYRLLSEAEWEYVARAGTRTARYWGEGESGQCRYANGGDREAKRHNSGWTVTDCDDGYYQTAPVGTYEANPFGLYDVLGNVYEWVEDCVNGGYRGAPSDGSAWESGDCGRRVLRGGSWSSTPWILRSAFRRRITTGFRFNFAGFRVARTLTP